MRCANTIPARRLAPSRGTLQCSTQFYAWLSPQTRSGAHSVVARPIQGAPKKPDAPLPHWGRLRYLPSADVDGVRWFWPAGENPRAAKWASNDASCDAARLLAPFDPVVWDRRRFEILWNWSYRFEAYTPAAKRVRGYYALPLLWRDFVIGWGNLSVVDNRLQAQLGYVSGKPPHGAAFKRALDEELQRIERFLDLN